MARDINQRLAGVGHSEIRAMTIECTKTKGLNLAQGVCDTPTPQEVIDGAAHGYNTYTRYDGLQILRKAIADKLARDNRLSANPNTDITVSPVPQTRFTAPPKFRWS